MIIKKFLLRALWLQALRLMVFIFMAFFIYFVFKTRSMAVFYAFLFIFSVTYISTLLKIIKAVLVFGMKTKKTDRKALYDEFSYLKPYCGKFYFLREYLLIFRVGFTDIDFDIVKYENIKAVKKEKTEKGNVRVSVFEEALEDKSRSLEYFVYADNEKDEFEKFYEEIKNKTDRERK